MYVQFALDRTLARMLFKDKEDEYNKYNIKLERFPYPAYIDDKYDCYACNIFMIPFHGFQSYFQTFRRYLFGLQAFLPLLLILSMIFPVINTTKCIVHEKEKRLKVCC